MLLQFDDDGTVSSVNEEELIYVNEKELEEFIEKYCELETENEQLKQEIKKLEDENESLENRLWNCRHVR